MPIGPTTYFGKGRVFVDREVCIQAFRENIQNLGTKEYNVLFYYGIAGIGKSKLQKELQKILDEEYPEIFWAAIDLNTKTYREVGTFLIALRNKIQEKYKAKFYLFNIAHAIYWKKLHPEILLLEQNYPLIKEEGFISKIIDILNEIRPGPLEKIPVRFIFENINNVPENIRRFFKEQVIDINVLTAMEAPEIEKLLPGFFAADFTDYLGTDSKAYIFIDTYEALWDGLRNEGSFHEKDKWIRDNLIPNMLGVSWIICGQEKLLWVSECDSDWDVYLEQHSVEELPESYCTKFLEDCGIENKDIRDIIIKASEGVPYYLNLSVDTFEKIYKKRRPIPEDFDKIQPEIFNTFVKYLEHNEIRALEVLSVPNFWDRTLFEVLMNKFGTGFPIGAFSELVKFSFIKINSDGKYSIHQLMRKSLQEYQDSADKKNVHKFMFEHYNNKLKEINIKAITPEHELALTEAFYHAKKSLEKGDLFEWFISVSDSFNKAAFWQLITPMYEEMLQILEAEFGPEHLDVAKTLNNLAELYQEMGDYKEALPLYQKAFEIAEKIMGSKHPDIAVMLNNLASLYESMGEYNKALSFCHRALQIIKSSLAKEHPVVAAIQNNLAVIYSQIGKYEKALTFYQKALETREKILGPEHLDVATTLNNIAELYRQKGEYDEALPLYQRALNIREKVLGGGHPDIATTLNSIAELYRQKGEYDEALPLYQRALNIREKVFGSNHPDVALILNNFGLLYKRMGEYNKALSFYQQALDIYENMLWMDHPEVARTFDNLADLYRQIEEYEKALPLYQRALRILENTFGEEHCDTAIVKNNFAAFYESIGDYEKALSLLGSALIIQEKVLGSDHPDVASTLNNIADAYHKTGRYNESLQFYERSLDIIECKLGIAHPYFSITIDNLIGLYNSMLEEMTFYGYLRS
ncbi:tetratricopeptide repeat protein [Methanosarcina barkeri]|uniref:Uncharacterized protein n=1 Tax=Methanosarcina barkeri 227 TaxID=1434106 RepID=A0A0E3R2Z8_METBA|nr:tetratricopeptide repeat protein [Methanosarcina barkeri]AKB58702.1 hypothetical protein MSBR2_2186 [Methanosarcina barkeri 227]